MICYNNDKNKKKMSTSDVSKRTKSVAHLDAKRPLSRGRDAESRGAWVHAAATRGKKDRTRDSTPKSLNDNRRASAPSPGTVEGAVVARSAAGEFAALPNLKSPTAELGESKTRTGKAIEWEWNERKRVESRLT